MARLPLIISFPMLVLVEEPPKMMGPATPRAKEPGEEVPTPRVPAEVPRVRPPEKVEVPRPFTFKRLASENEVEEAKESVRRSAELE